MFDDIRENFVGKRLGISFFKMTDFSIDRDLPRALNSIQGKKDESGDALGINKRIIQKFEYSPENRELYISALVEVPLKIKILNEENQISELTQYQIRPVYMKINLKTATIVVFGQGQKEVKEFVNYIRDLTVMRFNPIPIKVNPNKMKLAVNQYEKVKSLKIVTNNSDLTDYVRFGGDDILSSQPVIDILKESENEISDIFGVKILSGEKQIKLHINNRGRIWLYANPEDLSDNDLKNLINEIESLYFSNSVN